MREGGSNFKDAPAVSEEEKRIFDWINLPSSASALSLWDSLHDAHIVSIRSNLLERTVTLSCEVEHLRSFHNLGEGFQFILRLDGVQSARVLRYAVWPGGCSIPVGLSRKEERQLVAEYQAKWREESASWNAFESGVTREDEQIFDISDAALATSQSGSVALKLCGHLNYATYHEVFLRSEKLTISGSDGKQFNSLDWTSFNGLAKHTGRRSAVAQNPLREAKTSFFPGLCVESREVQKPVKSRASTALRRLSR